MRIIQPISAFDSGFETEFQAEHGAMAESMGSSSVYAYSEMADVPVHSLHPVSELQKNLAHLEELQSRMQFMMREVRYLLKV